MSGKELKTCLTALDDSLANVARKLGITSQGLESLFRTKDVKSGTIEKIAKLYNKPISWFYDEKETAPTIVEAVDHSVAANGCISDVKIGDYKELESKVKYLEDLISEKDKRIELQEKLISRLENN